MFIIRPALRDYPQVERSPRPGDPRSVPRHRPAVTSGSSSLPGQSGRHSKCPEFKHGFPCGAADLGGIAHLALREATLGRHQWALHHGIRSNSVLARTGDDDHPSDRDRTARKQPPSQPLAAIHGLSSQARCTSALSSMPGSRNSPPFHPFPLFPSHGYAAGTRRVWTRPHGTSRM